MENDVNHVSEDLEDLTLEDEKFVVKSLSHNTARKRSVWKDSVSGRLTWVQIIRGSSRIGTSPKRFAKGSISVC